MGHCEQTEECICSFCRDIAGVAEKINSIQGLRVRFGRRLEALLQAKFESTSKAKLMCDALRSEILAFSDYPIETIASPSNQDLFLSSPVFYQDSSGHYWMSQPRSDGWMTAKVTHTGYHKKEFHCDVFSFQARLDNLGLVQCDPIEPQRIILSPKFRIVSAMSDLYQDWKDGRIDKMRYDSVKVELLEQFNDITPEHAIHA